MQNKEWINIKEASEYTNRSIGTIRRWMQEEPKIRYEWNVMERCWMLNKEDIDAKLESFKRIK